MYLVINKWVIALNVSNFSGHYLLNHWTLDIGVLGYIGIVWPKELLLLLRGLSPRANYKEHPPEVWFVPSVTPCISGSPGDLWLQRVQAISSSERFVTTVLYPEWHSRKQKLQVSCKTKWIVHLRLGVLWVNTLCCYYATCPCHKLWYHIRSQIMALCSITLWRHVQSQFMTCSVKNRGTMYDYKSWHHVQ